MAELTAEEKIDLIHRILNEDDDEEALARIRVVLYGEPKEEDEE